MKEQEQIALVEKTIAKLCGWKLVEGSLVCYTKDSGATYTTKTPSYYTDLNACWDMEHTLRPPQTKEWDTWNRYFAFIEYFIGRDDSVHATAALKCKAFLWVHNVDLLNLSIWDYGNPMPSDEQIKHIVENTEKTN